MSDQENAKSQPEGAELAGTELSAEDLGNVAGGVRGYNVSGITSDDDSSDVKVK